MYGRGWKKERRKERSVVLISGYGAREDDITDWEPDR